MKINAYTFGYGDPAACIVGASRGNEVQQMYICSRLIHILKELERNGCVTSGKQIMVIPTINTSSFNIGKRFWTMGDTDINRSFPGDDYGDTPNRIAGAVLSRVKDFSFGIQFASFYMSGSFVPHVRMMETGYQSTSLANLFGLPYVVVHRPLPIDTRTLNYNWQDEKTAAFSVYTNCSDTIDEESARQAESAVLRFLTRMGIIRYECHSGMISHVLREDDLTNVHSDKGGIFIPQASLGCYVHYHQVIGKIMDPFEGEVKQEILAPTEGILFYSHKGPLIAQGDIVFRLIHRLHE